MSKKKRIETMLVIISASPINTSAFRSDIEAEIKSIISCSRIQGNHRYLLEVTHAARALETALRELLVSLSIPLGDKPSLAFYLTQFTKHASTLPKTLGVHQRNSYQNSVIEPRNTFMHNANFYPTSAIADSYTSATQSCLAEVINLVRVKPPARRKK